MIIILHLYILIHTHSVPIFILNYFHMLLVQQTYWVPIMCRSTLLDPGVSKNRHYSSLHLTASQVGETDIKQIITKPIN